MQWCFLVFTSPLFQFLILIFGLLIRTAWLRLWGVVFLPWSTAVDRESYCFGKRATCPRSFEICYCNAYVSPDCLFYVSDIFIYVFHRCILATLYQLCLICLTFFLCSLIWRTLKSSFLPKSCLCLYKHNLRHKHDWKIAEEKKL